MAFRKKRLLQGLACVCSCLCALFVGAELIAGSDDYKSTVNGVLGGGGMAAGKAEAFAFRSEYDSTTEMLTARKKIAEQIGEEGCVLLKNENGALPLRKNATEDGTLNVTVLGSRAYTYKADGTTLRDYLDDGNKLFFYGGATGSVVYEQNVTTYGADGNAETEKVPITLEKALSAENIRINPALTTYYSNKDFPKLLDGGEAAGLAGGAYCVNEPAVSASDLGTTADYDDACFVVIGRFSGEGRDYIPGAAGVKDDKDGGQKSALGLSDNERNLISLADGIAPGKVVVLLNSAVAMEIEELKNDDRVSAVLWIGLPGVYGLTGAARVISGNAVDEGKGADGQYRRVSPSGKLSDTYAVEASKSPAAQNFGVGATDADNEYSGTAYTWNNAAATGNTSSDDAHYVVLAEGLYTGYTYYETRYNDCVTGDGDTNAADGCGFDCVDGASRWNYADEVSYSFGYGMSYTSFSREWAEENAFVYDGEEKSVSLSVKVKNEGDYPAKDVVQIYVQTPYTDYDKAHGVEKSAIQLCGFAKTDTLDPGEEQTVRVNVPLKYIASYDKSASHDGYTGGYIMEKGNYYFSFGNGAHDALNNVLARRAYTAADGVYAEEGTTPDASAVYVWELKEGESRFSFNAEGVDLTYFSRSEDTDALVYNRLSDADYNYFKANTGVTVTYLTRTNYSGTFPRSYTGLTLPTTDLAKKQIGDKVHTFTTGTADGDIAFDVDHEEADEQPNMDVAELKLAAYDDGNWDYLLSQLSFTDAWHFSPYGGTSCIPLASVNAPEVYQIDGPNGNVNRGYGALAPAAGYLGVASSDPNKDYKSADMPCEPMIAATFNAELVKEEGKIFGEDNLWSRNPIMWAPGMNLHRTPFNSRNHEYYSEDAILTNVLGSAFVEGGLEKGSILSAKHFAFNTQESYREGLCQFMEEQSAREKELRAFEGLCEDVSFVNERGNEVAALGMMTSFSRVGLCGVNGHKGLTKEILRDEWGFKGLSSTDMVTGTYFFNPQDSVANNVVFMATSNGAGLLQGWTEYGNKSKVQKDPVLMRAIYDNMHYYLYSIANSSALNGISPGDSVSAGALAYWEWLLIGAGAVTLLAFAIVGDVKKRKSQKEEGAR